LVAGGAVGGIGVDPVCVAGDVGVDKPTGGLVGVSPEACAQELKSTRRNKTIIIFRILVILFS
jgi:hypothetical protein